MITFDGGNLRTRVTGATWPIRCTLVDVEGAPIDVTGYTFSLTVDPNENPASSATNLFTRAGTILDAATGLIQFAISSGEAALLVPLANNAAYWAWITVTDAGGKVDRAKMRLPVTGGPG